MSDYTGSNITAILLAVSAAMGVPNELGDGAAAAMGAPPRVVWRPHPDEDIKWVPPVMQPKDGVVFRDALEPYLVQVWGAGVTDARALLSSLILQLDNLFGVFAQSPVSAKPARDLVTSGSYGYEARIVLRVPEYRYRYGTATIETTEADGVVQTLAPSTDPLADPGQTTEIEIS